MTPTDKGILRSYLLEGEKAIAMLDAYSDKAAEKAVDKMTDDTVNSIVEQMKEANK
jgi:Mg/Co/Ni transporter MgtE